MNFDSKIFLASLDRGFTWGSGRGFSGPRLEASTKVYLGSRKRDSKLQRSVVQGFMGPVVEGFPDHGSKPRETEGEREDSSRNSDSRPRRKIIRGFKEQ